MMHRKVKKTIYSTLFYIVVAGIILVILTPIYFLTNISLMSDQEAYDWPIALYPSFVNKFKLELVEGKYLLSVYSNSLGDYTTIVETSDFDNLQKLTDRKTNSKIPKDLFLKEVEKAKALTSKNATEINTLRSQYKKLTTKIRHANIEIAQFKEKLSMLKGMQGMEDVKKSFQEKLNKAIKDREKLKEESKTLESKLFEIASVSFSVPKNLLENYITFFKVTTDAIPALIRSIEVALLTVTISLIIGGMAGYAFARYFFKGKNILKLSVLFVRMFPGISIAIPMVIILAGMGFYDKPIGLSLVYSIGQIGLTTWITASIFMGIPVELEEAAMIFGTTRTGAFLHITLPLAIPGLAASAMYAFIGSWSETAQAIVLTQFHPTFPVVVYQTLVGAKGLINLTAAGGMAMAIPAIIFTLIIRRYILQMWGGVTV
ncbi:ABC transporter permease subunit [Mesoaciditoga lauensis]|uniref:ABC transporter permease subunit n=1 Tax=Mesoaciditoga lauensis TaxID=1495039 RepID=UPI0005621BE4